MAIMERRPQSKTGDGTPRAGEHQHDGQHGEKHGEADQGLTNIGTSTKKAGRPVSRVIDDDRARSYPQRNAVATPGQDHGDQADDAKDAAETRIAERRALLAGRGPGTRTLGMLNRQ